MSAPTPTINIDLLTPHPQNDYFFDDITGDAWTTFLDSIRTSGVIEPIVITPSNMIVSGHQRVRACKELGIQDIKYVVNSYEDDDQILKDLIETNLRQRGIGNPNPVKLGRCIKELERIYGIQHGGDHGNQYTVASGNNFQLPKSQSELAADLNMDIRTMHNYKRLADLIPEVQDFLDTGMITPTTALAISRQLSMDDQKEFMSQLDKEVKYTQSKIQEGIDAFKNSESTKVTSRASFEKARADRLQAENDELKKRPPTIKERIVEVAPSDYETIKENNSALKRRVAELEANINKETTNSEAIRAMESDLAASKQELAELRAEHDKLLMEASQLRKVAEPDYSNTCESSEIYELLTQIQEFTYGTISRLENNPAFPRINESEIVRNSFLDVIYALMESCQRMLKRVNTQEVVDIESATGYPGESNDVIEEVVCF